jgi:hypothetical protein
MKTGGSNYWQIGGDSDYPPIGTFDLRRDVATQELQSMFEHGQRRITLVCFFSPLNFPAGRENHRWGHIISSYGGSMYGQHQQNLIDLLAIIREIGFNYLHFRFAATAEAADVNWPDIDNDGQPDWNRNQFNENAAFITSVRTLIEANRGILPVLYDLGLEYANSRLASMPAHELYCRQLWKRYTDAYGPNDSCAFSIIHGVTGLRLMLQKFRAARLPFPSAYCFDIYETVDTILIDALPVLRQYGEESKPVYIQETLYNDAQSYAEIKSALAGGVNIQCIFQWTKLRGQEPHFFPDVFPRRFDNYLVEI